MPSGGACWRNKGRRAVTFLAAWRKCCAMLSNLPLCSRAEFVLCAGRMRFAKQRNKGAPKGPPRAPLPAAVPNRLTSVRRDIGPEESRNVCNDCFLDFPLDSVVSQRYALLPRVAEAQETTGVCCRATVRHARRAIYCFLEDETSRTQS